MDKIYSRKRIHLPKIIMTKNKKAKKISAIIIISIITCISIIKAINPIFDELCRQKAKSVATIITNQESTKIINKYKYEDLVTVERDNDNNIALVKSNIVPINLLISDVAENVQTKLNENEEDYINIKMGGLTANKFLSGAGINIPVKIYLVGNVQTDLRSEFTSAGINQTLHKIYLQVDCNVSVMTPYNNINEEISNQVLIAESIIVGNIPSTYYNLEGIKNDNLLDVLE